MRGIEAGQQYPSISSDNRIRAQPPDFTMFIVEFGYFSGVDAPGRDARIRIFGRPVDDQGQFLLLDLSNFCLGREKQVVQMKLARLYRVPYKRR